MTPHKRRIARDKASLARSSLLLQISGCAAREGEKKGMRETLALLWASAEDAWRVDEGGPVYPTVQTQLRDEGDE